MYYKAFSILIMFIAFSSCNDNERKKQNSNEPIFKIVDRKNDLDDYVEKNDYNKLLIKNEIFHYSANPSRINEKNHISYGKYVNDRFGYKNSAIFLDGISDYVEIDNVEQLNPKKELTISIWYNPDSFKGIGLNSIVWKGYESYDEPYCQYFITATGNKYNKQQGSFKFGLSINGKFQNVKTPNNIWSPGHWYNITGSYGGGRMKLYVNGNLLGERKVFGKIDKYNSTLLIGKSPHLEYYTPGKFDDLRIFERALDEDEIKLIYLDKK